MLIYQLLPRLFGNANPACIPHGSLAQNGSGKFNDISTKVLEAIKWLGVSHVWLTGILEQASATDYSTYGIPPVDASLIKGKAGSPYAIKDYYDVSPDLAASVPQRMEEFTALIGRCHACGLQVIIDFVPNHVFRQYASDTKPEGGVDLGASDRPDLAFDAQNNFYYLPGEVFIAPLSAASGEYASSGAGAYREFPAKATGNDCFNAAPGISDWYETIKLNYGVDYRGGRTGHFSPIPNTWHKMLHILCFWRDKGVDGFRCDMAEMVPVDFWGWAIPQVKQGGEAPVFIAEVYQPHLYRTYLEQGCFDYLYDKVGLYDTLKAVLRHERPASDITHCWQALGDLQPKMLNFLENHDEQRIASDFFLGNGLKALPALVVSACLNTAPFMLYAGQEFGERGMDAEGFSGRDGRTSIFDYWSVGSLRRFYASGSFDLAQMYPHEQQLYAEYIKILNLTVREPALREGQTYDLMYANLDNEHFNPWQQFAFLRHINTETLLVAVNFGEQMVDMAIHIPAHAFEFLGIPQDRLQGTLLYSTGSAEQGISTKEAPSKKVKKVPTQSISLSISLNSTRAFPTQIPAHGAVVWKISRI